MRLHTLPRPACCWCEAPIDDGRKDPPTHYAEDRRGDCWHLDCMEEAASLSLDQREPVEVEGAAMIALEEVPPDPDPVEYGLGGLDADELRRLEAALRTAEERDSEGRGQRGPIGPLDRLAEMRGAEGRAHGRTQPMAGPAYTRVG